jgi:hypothetical protein
MEQNNWTTRVEQNKGTVICKGNKRDCSITYCMITSVGVLGKGNIAARYPASTEPALRRRRTVSCDKEAFNWVIILVAGNSKPQKSRGLQMVLLGSHSPIAGSLLPHLKTPSQRGRHCAGTWRKYLQQSTLLALTLAALYLYRSVSLLRKTFWE